MGHQKSKRIPENICFCFIDCAKAFDCVDHNKLWKILQEMEIPDHLFHLFLFVEGQPFHNIAVGFVIHWHELAMELHVFPIPIPPPISLSTRVLWVFLVHQARALVSCIPPGLVICFTTDNGHAVLSKHPTLAFYHRVQKSIMYICVSFSVLHIASLTSF